jgi:hypothetical protein
MTRSRRRRILWALLLAASCHMAPLDGGSGGCAPGSFSCSGDYVGSDAGEAGPRDELACWELCEEQGPGWVGRMVWIGTELVCDCREVGAVPCESAECAERCASFGFEHSTCDVVGCRCFHVPLDAGDDSADESSDGGTESGPDESDDDAGSE